MNVILGSRDIVNRKLGSLQYFDVPAGAFPIPWNQGKECADPDKCDKNALQGRFEGVSPEEYRRRQEAARAGMGFTKQELVIPVGTGPATAIMPTPPGFWPGSAPAYLYPVSVTNTPATAPAAEESGVSTKTLIIGGSVVVAGLLAVLLLKKG